ncbi:MAG: DUF3489 domain-containing protein [Parvularcula sp.]|nr:DUF3489 domain-containing protein [Parvularcula sp.]
MTATILAAATPEILMTTSKTNKQITKLDTLEKLMKRKNGVSIAELTKATCWQQHSVRGAVAGALKKRGHTITSEKNDGIRRYRIEETTGE